MSNSRNMYFMAGLRVDLNKSELRKPSSERGKCPRRLKPKCEELEVEERQGQFKTKNKKIEAQKDTMLPNSTFSPKQIITLYKLKI